MRFLYCSMLARGASETRQKDVSRVQVGQVADLIDEHRAAGTSSRWPAVHTRGEHEVIEDQLAASLEQVAESHLAAPRDEFVRFFDFDHRQPAALGGERHRGPAWPPFL